MLGTKPGIDIGQILSILNSIAGQLDYRRVVQAVSAEIVDKLPHAHLDVALLSGDGMMVTAYETGLHTEWDAATTARAPVAISPIRDLFNGKCDYIITDNAQSDERFHFPGAFSKAVFSAGLKSRLHVPLKVERRVVGALSFSTQWVGTYTLSHVHDAQIVADILAPYFFALLQSELVKRSELQKVEAEARAEGLRTGARHLTEELENARQAIGMDLHDQTLADLSRISRAMRRLSARPDLQGSELDPLLEDVEHCIHELRVIIDNARPSVLQLFGFSEAVETMLDRSVASALSPMTYRLADDSGGTFETLPPNIVVTLYRIVQEAINNAVRHAQARHVEVRLGVSDGQGRIVVEDDGIGISDPDLRHRGGINNMKTRASLIQASLCVRAGTEGKGTRLELRVSLGQDAIMQQETVR